MLEKILGILQPEKSFDLVRRDMEIAGRPCTLLFVDGMIKDEVMEKMLEYFLKLDHSVWDQIPDSKAFSRRIIPYVEVADEDQLDAACTAILSGNLGLFIQGFSSCALIDIRTYPARSVEEPEKDKVLRGSRDGFVETVVFNTALIRRRIRDPKLTMSILSAGESSHTDIVVCYMEDRADLELVQRVKERIGHIKVQGLTMSQESLAEALISSKWRNPFPKTRYTERPDTAAAALLEGRIIILVDNSPSAMILPSGIFDFFREADRLLFSSHYRNVFADYPYRHFSINPVFNPVVAFVGGTSSVDPPVAVLYRCVKTQWRAAFSTAAGAGIRCGWTSYGVYQYSQHYEQLLEYYRSASAGRFCGPVRVVCAGNHSVCSLYRNR